MNFASWIILLIVIVWIGFAVRSAFFGGKRKKGDCHGGDRCDAKTPRDDVAALDDEKYRLPSACAGCSKASCSGCASASRRDVPMPTIHEL